MTPDKINVLIVDDETELVRAFKKKLDGEGFSVSVALRARDVFPLLEKQAFDVAVLDIKLPDMDGVDLLKALKEAEPSLEIIMLTGHASIDTAINSMRIGAYDYLTKPCKLSELTNVLLKAYEKKALREKNLLLESRLDRTRVDGTLVGGSLPMQEMKQLISVVGNSAVPVLVTGRDRHGKGACCPGDTRLFLTLERVFRCHQFQHATGEHPRERTLRVQKGCLYRRQDRQGRACSRWHTTAPSSWTRSAIWALPFRRSSSGSSKPGRS